MRRCEGGDVVWWFLRQGSTSFRLRRLMTRWPEGLQALPVPIVIRRLNPPLAKLLQIQFKKTSLGHFVHSSQ